MAALAVHTLVDAGTAPTGVNLSADDTISDVGNGRNVVLVATATTAADVTVSVDGTTSYGGVLPSVVISLGAGEQAWIPIRREFVDPDDGLVHVSSDQADTDAVVVKVA